MLYHIIRTLGPAESRRWTTIQYPVSSIKHPERIQFNISVVGIQHHEVSAWLA